MASEGALLETGSREWLEALDAVPHDTYHLPGYVTVAAEAQDGHPLAFRYTEAGRMLLLPLVVRPVPGVALRDVTSPYGYAGPVGDPQVRDDGFWRRAAAEMVRVLRSHDVVAAFLRLHPLLPVPLHALQGYGRVVDHGPTVSVDLLQTQAQIWAGTRKTHRNEINKARRAGVHVTWDEWQHLDAWRAIYHENMRALCASPEYFFSPEYFLGLRDRLGRHVHLALAWQDTDMLAGQVVLETGGIVQTHLSGMRSDRRRLHPDKLLYDEVRRWGKARGNRVHHLGGGYGGSEDGLLKYKAGFSDRRHVFRTWRVVVDQDPYDELVHRAGVDGQVDGFFPAYRRPARELAGR